MQEFGLTWQDCQLVRQVGKHRAGLRCWVLRQRRHDRALELSRQLVVGGVAALPDQPEDVPVPCLDLARHPCPHCSATLADALAASPPAGQAGRSSYRRYHAGSMPSEKADHASCMQFLLGTRKARFLPILLGPDGPPRGNAS